VTQETTNTTTKTRREVLRAGALVGLLAAAGGRTFAAASVQGQPAPAGAKKGRTILEWSEGTAPTSVYPNDIRGAVADALAKLPGGYVVKTATLSDVGQGVPQETLDDTAVLFWWGHERHGRVTDETVARIVKRVREGGMGLVALHSSHYAKPFKAVLPADGSWKEYTNDGKPHRIVVANKNHPLARGVRDFTIPKEERYEEPFQVPAPEAVVLDGVHEANGNHARQLLTWTVGRGRVVYFRPGHEEFPVYFQPEVKRVLRNIALFAANDEAGIWEDNDPSAKAARAAGEPPLSLILRDAGYGGTQVVAGGEIPAQLFVKAGPGGVTFRPLAAFGVPHRCTAGWYRQTRRGNDQEIRRTVLWRLDEKHNKQMAPPILRGGRTSFDPGSAPFGLWVATEGFPGEVIYTEDALQAAIKRFPADNRHKAHVYAAVKSDNNPVANAVLIGFEYSTNDDNQEVVALVENARPAPVPA
jgi:trehalose utilization protein